MKEPEKNEQDVFTPSQKQKQLLPNTDAVKFASSPSPTNLRVRLGLLKKSSPNPMEEIKHRNWQKRVMAVQALADLERNAPVSTIQACLQDPHEAVRMASLRALGKLWNFGTVPLELFLLALGDKHAEVRSTAVQVLETLGPQALIDPVIRHLVSKLHDHSPDESRETGGLADLQPPVQREEAIVCVAIVHLLGTLDEKAPVHELIYLLADPDWQIREAALSALGKLGERVPEALLLDALYDAHRFVRDAAISVLEDRLPVEMLLSNLFTLDPLSRKKTADLLGDVGERTQQKSVVRALLRSALTDQNSSVRKASLLALGQIGMPISRTAIPQLVQDYDRGVREVAMLVLSGLHPDFLDEQGNINPDYLKEEQLEGEHMENFSPHERITEQGLQSVMPLPPGKPWPVSGEADYTNKRIGNYRLLKPLARGGQATVYLGEHIHLYTQVAVKVLHRHLSDQDKQFFLEEARTIARLHHPNIVRVLDCSVEDGIPYIAMDYIPRGTLRNLLASSIRIQIWIVVVYVKQLASALDYAHKQGVIHLDIKPENILLGENHTVLLSDFGISKRIGDSSRWTAGTLSYAAPEQLEGKPTAASDQYALAIIVYELLTGSYPYEETYIRTRRSQQYSSQPLYKKSPFVSKKVQQVVLKALEKDAKNRYPNILAFAHALEKASLSRGTIFSLNFLQYRKEKEND